MRKYILPLLVLALGVQVSIQAQSTASSVYTIFQNNCNSSGCHNANDAAGGLDLEGSGATLVDRIQSIKNATFDAASQQSFAAAEGYKIIYPGDPYRSTLFRRVHGGLDYTVTPDAQEGDLMPAPGNALADADIELIRQWILFGSPETGKVVDSLDLVSYYNGNAIPSFTSAPAPPPSGFQVHLGPFFLSPNAEDEYFWKYNPAFDDDLEIVSVEPIFGQFSHHFILNRFLPGDHSGYRDGLRSSSSHFDAQLVSVHQFSDTLALPDETAFYWERETWLDFNSHYINYDFNKVLAADVYLNIRTQPKNTATQIMKSEMVPNFAIFIPANNQPVDFELPYFNPLDNSERFIWSVTSHTHKYGTDFKVYTRNSNGSKDDQIYDASYKDGDPLGLFIGYDYQHPPQRFFYPYLPINLDEGVTFTAEYLNYGTQNVSWGSTSDDEMMLLIYYYLDDTSGLPIAMETAAFPDSRVNVWPNPGNQTKISVSGVPARSLKLQIRDLNGRLLEERTQPGLAFAGTAVFDLDDLNLANGTYVYQLSGDDQLVKNGKFIIQR